MKDHVLYSFSRCPYAMRARWAIIKSKIIVNLREVNLKQKPKELIKLSPKATVPLLITRNGQIIDESIDIIEWAIDEDKNTLILNNKSVRSQIDELINQNDSEFKFHLDRYKYASRYSNSEKMLHQNLARKILLYWNSLICKNSSQTIGFLTGSNESLADWAIWPFVRQYKLTDPSKFTEDNELNGIKDWLNFYIEDPLFKILMIKHLPWESTQSPIYFPQVLSQQTLERINCD